MESSQSSNALFDNMHPKRENETQNESQCECETHEIQSQMYFTLRVARKKSYPRTRAGKNCNCTACNGQKDKAAEQEAVEEEQEELPPGTFTCHMNNATSCRLLQWWRILL